MHSFSVIKYIMSAIVVVAALCLFSKTFFRSEFFPALFASYSYLYSLVSIINRVNEEFNVDEGWMACELLSL